MVQMLGQEECETPLDRLSDMEAQRIVGTLADTLPEAKAEILHETPSDVESKILVDKLERTLAEAKSERLGAHWVTWSSKSSFKHWLTRFHS